ncbi:DNA polymerase III subunit chi [Azohydromonas caseinilytica]|uniref:DNA polymerase III subunit chi n=1 Tax=Azohydromonas caseinilytica TaxID=2728836 RepID=UPI001F23D07B|nr:DNA polymerase III subunit chi [Azohydromonas caseinilytica]
MTLSEVAFHTGVGDKIGYCCRLLRKGYRQQVRMVVAGSADVLARLDQALWLFDVQSFIPHRRLKAGEAVPPALWRTPIWLIEPGAEPPQQGVLLNLGPAVVPGFERFERLIEVVGLDEEDRMAARQRWRAYETQGLRITHHAQNGH